MSRSTRRPPTTESLGPAPDFGRDEDDAGSPTDFQDLVRARYRTLPRADAEPERTGVHRVGQMVGSVRLEEVIGTGGMGRVYRGFDERLERSVAVKTVLRAKLHRRGARARLHREARLLSRLNHPRICQLYDLVETPAADFLILELVEGENLGELLDRGACDRQQGLAWAEEIAEALLAAHRRGIVHRDLKPENVMVTAQRGVKVLDFGIARSPESEAILDEEAPPGNAETHRRFQTLRGTVVGTAAYMSPEQARGEPVTPASDLYSFGVLLEEMLSGQEPVPEGTQPATIVRLVAEGQRPRPPAALPKPHAQLVARLLASDPGDRPGAAETLAAIRRLRNRKKRLLRRSFAALAILAVVAGVAKYTVDLREQEQRAQEARQQAEDLVSFLLEDLREGLEPLGRLDLLERVARRSLAYFESDPGQPRPAAEAEALRQVAQVLLDRGDNEGALQAYQHARQLDEGSTAMGVAERDRQVALAEDEIGIASVVGNRAEHVEALEAASSAASRLRSLGSQDAEATRKLAELLSFDVSEIHRSLGDLEGAKADFAEARELLSELHRSDPTLPANRVARGRYHYALGLFSYFDLGDPDASLDHFDQAVEIYEGLVREAPSHSQYRYRLAVLQGQGRCTLLGVLGRRDEAVVACGNALEAFRQLTREESANGRWEHALGWEYLRSGALREEMGDLDGARSAYERAVEIQGDLVRRASENEDWQVGYGAALQAVAETRRAGGEVREALEWLGEARQVWSRLGETDAQGAWLSELAAVDLEMAELHEELGEPAAAQEDLERALRSSELVQSLTPDAAAVRIQLGYVLVEIGASQWRLGERAQAEANLERGLDHLEGFTEPDPLILESRALALLLLERLPAARQALARIHEEGLRLGDVHPELPELSRERGIDPESS